MKVTTAETLANGSRRFVIEAILAIPAVFDAEGKETSPFVPAVTEEFVWGKDVALADARRETKALLNAKYGARKPTPIATMVGKEI